MGNIFSKVNRLPSGKGTARAETPNHGGLRPPKRQSYLINL